MRAHSARQLKKGFSHTLGHWETSTCTRRSTGFSLERYGDAITLISFTVLSLLIIYVADYFREAA